MVRARIISDHPQYSTSILNDLRSRGFEVSSAPPSDDVPEESADLEIRVRRCSPDDFSPFSDLTTSNDPGNVSIFLTPEALAGNIHSVEFFVVSEKEPDAVTETVQDGLPSIKTPEDPINSDDLVPHGLIWQAIASQENRERQEPPPAGPPAAPPSAIESNPAFQRGPATARPSLPAVQLRKWTANGKNFAERNAKRIYSALVESARRVSPTDRRFRRAAGLAALAALVVLSLIPFVRNRQPVATVPASIGHSSSESALTSHQTAQETAKPSPAAARHSAPVAEHAPSMRTTSAIRRKGRKAMRSDADYVAPDTVVRFRAAHPATENKRQAGVQYFSDLQ